jgi:hypothetical protein
MLLPAAASLLGFATDRSELVISLINFATLDPRFKTLSVSFITQVTIP